MAAKSNGQNAKVLDGPINPMVTPLLTDLYQFTMAYAYWKAGKHNERAVWVVVVFIIFFSSNPPKQNKQKTEFVVLMVSEYSLSGLICISGRIPSAANTQCLPAWRNVSNSLPISNWPRTKSISSENRCRLRVRYRNRFHFRVAFDYTSTKN